MTGARKISFGVAGLLACVAAGGAVLHHGWSEYDATRTLTLTGTVQAVRFSNPHVMIGLQTAGGEAKRWEAVLAPPARMRARGLPAAELRAGLTARVVGYPHKTEASEMRAERIIIAGDTTELR